MKERPILFSAPMVKALLAGTKTQTRRAMRIQPHQGAEVVCGEFYPIVIDRHGDEQPGPEVFGAWWSDGEQALRCPYGSPGHRLWVKEKTIKVEDHGWVGPVYAESECGRQAFEWGYGETDDPDHIPPHAIKCRPSLFMTRAMSRITLEIAVIQVQRLQDISVTDCLAEGITKLRDGGFGLDDGSHYDAADARQSYFSLWEAINGRGSVESNPFVWCVSFRRS